MRQTAVLLLATMLAVPGAPVSRRRPPRAAPRPRVGPLTLFVGETVSIGGFLYTVAYGLIPTGVTPVPIPLPAPIPPVPIPPVPIPPVPTPIPGPAPFISGYRDGQRNPQTLFSPGQTVFIDGSSFGPPAGTVSVNNTVAKVYAWTDTEIAIIAPPLNSFPPGPVTLTIFRLDKQFLTTAPAFTLR